MKDKKDLINAIGMALIGLSCAALTVVTIIILIKEHF